MPSPERNLRKTPLLSLLLHCPHLLVLVRFKRQALAYFEAIRVTSLMHIQTWNILLHLIHKSCSNWAGCCGSVRDYRLHWVGWQRRKLRNELSKFLNSKWWMTKQYPLAFPRGRSRIDCAVVEHLDQVLVREWKVSSFICFDCSFWSVSWCCARDQGYRLLVKCWLLRLRHRLKGELLWGRDI